MGWDRCVDTECNLAGLTRWTGHRQPVERVANPLGRKWMADTDGDWERFRAWSGAAYTNPVKKLSEYFRERQKAWSGAGTAAPVKTFNDYLEAGAGSALLLASAMASVALANSGRTATSWLALWAMNLGPAIGGHALSLRGWVNEGLMALFFFNVGLEIKKELTDGSLSDTRKAILPCIAACGGMVVPMLVYLAFNAAMPGGSLAGITIPMATDIAFAMGVFGFFRRHMPASAEPFLLTLATVDDLGAIAVIAICFAGSLSPGYLLGAAVALGAAFAMGRRGVGGSSGGFLLPGAALWYCLLRGGLNADIAGFLVALCVPMRSLGGADVVERLIHRWTPFCTLLVLPLFALANCAVPLGGFAGAALPQESLAVATGVFFGLLAGKPIGIAGFTCLSVKCGVAALPPGVTGRHLAIIGLLGSMGFTMCLFLIENSLVGVTSQTSKIGMLLASALGGLLSSWLMSRLPERPPANTVLVAVGHNTSNRGSTGPHFLPA